MKSENSENSENSIHKNDSSGNMATSIHKNDSPGNMATSIHRTYSIGDEPSIEILNNNFQSYVTHRSPSADKRRLARCTTLMTPVEISFLSKSISIRRKKRNTNFKNERDMLLSQIKKKKSPKTSLFFHNFWNLINPFSLFRRTHLVKVVCG